MENFVYLRMGTCRLSAVNGYCTFDHLYWIIIGNTCPACDELNVKIKSFKQKRTKETTADLLVFYRKSKKCFI